MRKAGPKGGGGGIKFIVKNNEIPKDFNNMVARGKLAYEQIGLIGNYIEDFNKLIRDVESQKESDKAK